MIDIIGKRYIFLAISLIVIVPGFIALGVWGLPLSIDFTGGSLLEAQLASGVLPETSDIINMYHSLGVDEVLVQTTSDNSIIVRTKYIDESTNNKVLQAINNKFNTQWTILLFENVGPSVGQEIAIRAAGAVGLAALGILLYITYSFRGVKNAHRYGASAILAMIHDVAVVIGMEAILGHFLGWEADALFLTALLTVIGFSVHDSIVVFDRIRENATIHRRLSYETLVNHSIVQTLDRSINTQLTVLFTLLALALFGGLTIRHFVVTLLIGILSGTYSSIFNAAPILVIWENREWKQWFRKKNTLVSI